MDTLARATFRALGTDAVIVTADPDELDDAEHLVRGIVEDIDRTCSRFRDDSDLARVNDGAGHSVPVDTLLLDAIEVALRAARLTNGIVDPTIGRAIEVLGYDRDFDDIRDGVPPTARVAFVPGWHAVWVDRRASTVRIPAGARLDLGATAKAYAADLAAEAAADACRSGVLVSLGGDIRVAGPVPEAGWAVRVTDWQGSPIDAPGQTVVIRSGGLATSSVTVRRWQRGDETVHHLIDPRTGRPADVCWRTISAAATTCVDANIATTAATVLGQDAERWLTDTGLPARLVAPAGDVHYLNGWTEEAA